MFMCRWEPEEDPVRRKVKLSAEEEGQLPLASSMVSSPRQAGDQEHTGEVDTVLTGTLQDPQRFCALAARASDGPWQWRCGKDRNDQLHGRKPFESTTSTVGANACDIESSACDVSLRDG